MLDMRKEFRYGTEEKVAKCVTGDGLMAIFCILAKRRPAGTAYREEIRDRLGNIASGFKSNGQPAAIGSKRPARADLDEAIDLDIKLQWSRTGKPVVAILSERSNMFSQVLSVYLKKKSFWKFYKIMFLQTYK